MLLESRNNPAPFIPGWDGPEQIAYGHFDGDNFADKAVVADAGGSCRVMVLQNPHNGTPFDADREWPVLLNTIVFDENFRGGGRIAVVPHSLDADRSVPDSLLVVPGPGGGPVVAQFDFATGERFDFFAPYGEAYRGGLHVATGDIDGDRQPEALFLPGEGGSPRLVAVDMRTHETEWSVFVGDPVDRSGQARFEPTGGTISKDDREFVFIQFGDAADFRVESELIPIHARS